MNSGENKNDEESLPQGSPNDEADAGAAASPRQARVARRPLGETTRSRGAVIGTRVPSSNDPTHSLDTVAKSGGAPRPVSSHADPAFDIDAPTSTEASQAMEELSERHRGAQGGNENRSQRISILLSALGDPKSKPKPARRSTSPHRIQEDSAAKPDVSTVPGEPVSRVKESVLPPIPNDAPQTDLALNESSETPTEIQTASPARSAKKRQGTWPHGTLPPLSDASTESPAIHEKQQGDARSGGAASGPKTLPPQLPSELQTPSEEISAKTIKPPPIPKEIEANVSVIQTTEAAPTPSANTNVSSSNTNPGETSPMGMQFSPKAWFEDLFNEEYLTTLSFVTPELTRNEVDFYEQSLALSPGQKLFDFGFGTGRHAIEFAARGYQVSGCDGSSVMTHYAQTMAARSSVTANLINMDIRDVDAHEEYDGAICVGTTFGFFDDDVNRQIISAMQRVLKVGARLVIETMNRDYLIRDLPARNWWDGDGCLVLEEVDFNYFTSRALSKRTLIFENGKHSEREISIRCYSLHELGKLLHHAGFRVLEVSGHVAHRGIFLGNHSRSLMLLAEKRKSKRGGAA